MRLIRYHLSDDDMGAFESLKKRTNSKTDTELIDNAITILQWAVEQVVNHRQVASFDPKRKMYRALLMQALKNAGAKAVKLAESKSRTPACHS